MARRRSCTPEQIITKLREAEVLLIQGKSIAHTISLDLISNAKYKHLTFILKSEFCLKILILLINPLNHPFGV